MTKRMNWEEEIRQLGPLVDYPIFLPTINDNEIWRMKDTVIYLHIPFCKQICTFCCYNESKNIYNKDIEDEYVWSVRKELKLIKKRAKNINANVKGLYLGGGTPTTFSGNSLKKLIIAIKEELDISDVLQICVESNPVLINKEILYELKEIGVNRISLGLQSCDDNYLNVLNCPHKFEDFIRAFNLVKEAGIEFLNVDLMYRLPGQSLEEWISSITQVINMSPEHISIYSLGVINNTKLYADLKNSNLPDVPSVIEEMEMRKHAKSLLFKNGYSMNKLDEFSKKGCENIYSITSRLGQTIALGAGATGLYGDILYQNIVDIKKYIQHINEDKLPVKHGVKLMGKEKIARYMSLMPYYLGFNMKEFEYIFGISVEQIYSKILEQMIQNGYMTIIGENYILTDKGEVFAYKVSQEFYSQEQKDVVSKYLDLII